MMCEQCGKRITHTPRIYLSGGKPVGGSPLWMRRLCSERCRRAAREQPRGWKQSRERDMRALELRNQGKTLNELGEILGLSRERVRQLICRARQVLEVERTSEDAKAPPESYAPPSGVRAD